MYSYNVYQVYEILDPSFCVLKSVNTKKKIKNKKECGIRGHISEAFHLCYL